MRTYITWKKGCCNASSAAGLFEGSHEHSRYGQPRRKVSDIILRCYLLNSNVVNKFDSKIIREACFINNTHQNQVNSFWTSIWNDIGKVCGWNLHKRMNGNFNFYLKKKKMNDNERPTYENTRNWTPGQQKLTSSQLKMPSNREVFVPSGKIVRSGIPSILHILHNWSISLPIEKTML